MNIVTVVWHDAHADRSGGWVQQDAIDGDPYVVSTAGWLINPAPKDGHVSIAQSSGDDGSLDHVIHIPIKMVQDLRVWDASGDPAVP